MTAEKWVPIIEVPVSNLKGFLHKKKREGFSILGLEQTANSIPLDQYDFPKKTVRHYKDSEPSVSCSNCMMALHQCILFCILQLHL